MILHTFGDSHAGHDWYNWNAVRIEGLEIKTNWRGGWTCAKFAMKGISIMDISEYGVKDGDMVLFSFGEVDCREHMHKHKEDYKEVIEFIVRKYFKSIQANVGRYNNLTTMVYCIPPIVRDSDIKHDFDLRKGENSSAVIKCVRYFNDKLKEECERYGYIFFDIYDNYCDEYGYLKAIYGDGNVHIKDPVFIEEELKRILWKE